MFGKTFKKKILVTGGTGNLGKALKKNTFFKNSHFPSKEVLNILDKNQLKVYFDKNKYNIIIHCAAIARMYDCEVNKKKAYLVNVIGTSNLAKITKDYCPNALFVYISSDAVYPCVKGNYKENSKLKSYNYYGKTKIFAENKVKKNKNYLIIRTRFFDKKKIRFKDAAIDSYSSSIEINLLTKYLEMLVKKNCKGIFNVGRKKISDYNLLKRYKKNIKKTTIKKIREKKKYNLSIDASMNCNKFKKILNVKK
jgi:dTDP-4-dehydrorhamnose reductase